MVQLVQCNTELKSAVADDGDWATEAESSKEGWGRRKLGTRPVAVAEAVAVDASISLAHPHDACTPPRHSFQAVVVTGTRGMRTERTGGTPEPHPPPLALELEQYSGGGMEGSGRLQINDVGIATATAAAWQQRSILGSSAG